MLRPRNSSSAWSRSRSMPYPARPSERQRQLSTSLSTSTPSQSKMMRSGLVIAGVHPIFHVRSEHMPTWGEQTRLDLNKGGIVRRLREGEPDFQLGGGFAGAVAFRPLAPPAQHHRNTGKPQ